MTMEGSPPLPGSQQNSELFRGCIFCVDLDGKGGAVNKPTSVIKELETRIEKGGGSVLEAYGPTCTHVILRHRDQPLYKKLCFQPGLVLVNPQWVLDCWAARKVLVPKQEHDPLRGPAIPDGRVKEMSVTNIKSTERMFLRYKAECLGFNFNGTFQVGAATHLVVGSANVASQKVNAARRSGSVLLVTPAWLDACLREWRHVSEGPYLVDLPKQLDGERLGPPVPALPAHPPEPRSPKRVLRAQGPPVDDGDSGPRGTTMKENSQLRVEDGNVVRSASPGRSHQEAGSNKGAVGAQSPSSGAAPPDPVDEPRTEASPVPPTQVLRTLPVTQIMEPPASQSGNELLFKATGGTASEVPVPSSLPATEPSKEPPSSPANTPAQRPASSIDESLDKGRKAAPVANKPSPYSGTFDILGDVGATQQDAMVDSLVQKLTSHLEASPPPDPLKTSATTNHHEASTGTAGGQRPSSTSGVSGRRNLPMQAVGGRIGMVQDQRRVDLAHSVWSGPESEPQDPLPGAPEQGEHPVPPSPVNGMPPRAPVVSGLSKRGSRRKLPNSLLAPEDTAPQVVLDVQAGSLSGALCTDANAPAAAAEQEEKAVGTDDRANPLEPKETIPATSGDCAAATGGDDGLQDPSPRRSPEEATGEPSEERGGKALDEVEAAPIPSPSLKTCKRTSRAGERAAGGVPMEERKGPTGAQGRAGLEPTRKGTKGKMRNRKTVVESLPDEDLGPEAPDGQDRLALVPQAGGTDPGRRDSDDEVVLEDKKVPARGKLTRLQRGGKRPLRSSGYEELQGGGARGVEALENRGRVQRPNKGKELQKGDLIQAKAQARELDEGDAVEDDGDIAGDLQLNNLVGDDVPEDDVAEEKPGVQDRPGHDEQGKGKTGRGTRRQRNGFGEQLLANRSLPGAETTPTPRPGPGAEELISDPSVKKVGGRGKKRQKGNLEEEEEEEEEVHRGGKRTKTVHEPSEPVPNMANTSSAHAAGPSTVTRRGRQSRQAALDDPRPDDANGVQIAVLDGELPRVNGKMKSKRPSGLPPGSARGSVEESKPASDPQVIVPGAERRTRSTAQKDSPAAEDAPVKGASGRKRKVVTPLPESVPESPSESGGPDQGSPQPEPSENKAATMARGRGRQHASVPGGPTTTKANKTPTAKKGRMMPPQELAPAQELPTDKTPKPANGTGGKGKGAGLESPLGSSAGLVVALSGLHTAEREQYRSVLRKLRIKHVSSTHSWEEGITHIVLPSLKRSDKTLCGMAAGAWLLGTRYLDDALKEGALPASPADYELHTCGSEAVSNGAPAHWRTRRAALGVGAYHGLRVILYGTLEHADSLVRAIRAGGGLVVKRGPPFNDVLEGDMIANVAVMQRSKTNSDKWVKAFLSAGIVCVDASYLVEWVAHPWMNLGQHCLFGSKPSSKIRQLEHERGTGGEAQEARSMSF